MGLMEEREERSLTASDPSVLTDASQAVKRRCHVQVVSFCNAHTALRSLVYIVC